MFAVLLKSIRMGVQITLSHDAATRTNTLFLSCGIVLPVAFAVISLPVAGVSYRVGNVCVPNHPSAMVAWYGWLLAFAIVNGMIQVATSFYCLWVYTRSICAEEPDSARLSTSGLCDRNKKHAAWRKVRRILALQWRGIALAFVTVNLTIYFGIVYVQQVKLSPTATVRSGVAFETTKWFECLTAHYENKDACLNRPTGLGLSESRAVGTLILAAVREALCLEHSNFH